MKLSCVNTITVVVVMTLVAGCSLFDRPVTVPPPTSAPVAPVDTIDPTPVEFTVLHKADYNIDDSPTTKSLNVVDTQADYQAALARYSVEVPKPIDFARQRVVFVTMGTQPSGGYAIGVQSATESTESVLVTVLLRTPGPGCTHTQALSNPYEFAVLETAKAISFEEVSEIESCNQ